MVAYTDELGRSTVTPQVLPALKDEGKLADLKDVHAPGPEVVPMPREDETIVFVAFLDVALRLPCVDSMVQVLQMYRVDLAQLTPNSRNLVSSSRYCGPRGRVMGRRSSSRISMTGDASRRGKTPTRR